jgi:anion-transporting  ArsA/GET3 family ATPase
MSPLRSTHSLLVVSGKGGVGKSALATSLARLSAQRGRRTVLVTLDTREERHPFLDVPLTYRPRMVSERLSVARVDAFEAMTDYARSRMPFSALYEGFFRSRAFRDFAAAAPGFDELMCLGRLYNLTVEREFDRVVFDAPATGHLRTLLGVPMAVQRAVQVGPVNHVAGRIRDLLLDTDRTHVCVATLAEEMPVREAQDLVALCRDELRMSVGPVLVNRRVHAPFRANEWRALEESTSGAAISPGLRSALEAARVEMDAARAQAAARGSRDSACRAGASRARGTAPAHRRSARTAAGRPRVSSALDLADTVRARRIVVCCGSGGVGKTTSAAALGVLAARQGVRALVMTIDPARRLAQALGLDGLGHEPQRIDLEAQGELWAMMLDSKRAFDRLVEQLAPDARVREAIFANRYYQQVSTALGGSRELVAMERVLEAVAEGRWDLLVVDTPPSQHALDFLDAPERIVSLLDGSMTSMLLRPYGVAARAQFRLFQQSSNVALKFFERLTGVQLFADLSEFMLAFSSLFDGFRERSHQVQALMRESSTAFLLVCAPEPGSLRQARAFAARLAAERMNVAGVLANRVHPRPASDRFELTADDSALLVRTEAVSGGGSPLAERLAAAHDRAIRLHDRDVEALGGIADLALPMHRVAQLGAGLSGLEDLEAFAELLRADAA